MKYIFLILVFFFSERFIYSQLVVINDAYNFNKKIKAEEHGFLIYREGWWEQTGANIKSEPIHYFGKDFSPAISASGINVVKCTYYDVGWFWPISGKTVTSTFGFITSPLIKNFAQEGNITVVDVLPYRTVEYTDTSPVTANLTIDYSISVTRTEESSFNCTRVQTNSYQFTGKLSDIIAIDATFSDGVTHGIAKALGVENTITYSFAPSFTVGPVTFDTNIFTAGFDINMKAKKKKFLINYYNDIDKDGLCTIGDLTTAHINYYFDPAPGFKITLYERDPAPY